MRKMIPGFVIVALLVSWTECHAQSLFGSSGALSSTSSANGGSSSGGSARSSSGSGASGNSSSGLFGNSGSSRSGQSGNGANNTTLGQTSQLNAGDGSLGATIGTSGFVGRGDNASRFVGSQNASATNRRGNTANQFSMLQSIVGNNNFDQNASATTSNAPRIVPQVKLGFQTPSTVQADLQSTVQTRLVALPALGDRIANVQAVADQGGTIVLTGMVDSREDAHLLETLVRMEPGVRTVKNELTVAATSPAATPLPLR